MLDDRAKIHVQAGAGGDGCVSFRREAHVPRGGPDGGDGGRGGDVIVVCDESLRDLQGVKRRTHYRAGRGGSGEGALRHGADGKLLVIGVPPGTQIVADDEQAGDLLGHRWELLAGGQRATLARAGVGGRGNKRFATPTHQAPRFAERGLPGEEGWLELRLKLLADVGLVGLPNAGKSSLLARLTRATPKVADYPFTTLSPVLGVLDAPSDAGSSSERQLVLADIPGLIAGASEGAGLGHDFLAHVERTRLLVHVLDIAPELSMGEDADPLANHATIERELAAHDQRLARLPRVLALTKTDLLPEARARERIEEWRRRLGPEVPVIATSSATGAGLAQMRSELLRRVAEIDADELAGREAPRALSATGAAGPSARGVAVAEVAPAAGSIRSGMPAIDDPGLAEHMVFRPAPAFGFRVEQLGPGAFAVRGSGIERLLARFDIDNDDAMAYLEGRLRRIGVIKALEAAGFQPGDEVEIAGVTFELDPS
jgi:GTPase